MSYSNDFTKSMWWSRMHVSFLIFRYCSRLTECHAWLFSPNQAQVLVVKTSKGGSKNPCMARCLVRTQKNQRGFFRGSHLQFTSWKGKRGHMHELVWSQLRSFESRNDFTAVCSLYNKTHFLMRCRESSLGRLSGPTFRQTSASNSSDLKLQLFRMRPEARRTVALANTSGMPSAPGGVPHAPGSSSPLQNRPLSAAHVVSTSLVKWWHLQQPCQVMHVQQPC
jgi:hypothetical protein